MHVAPEGDTFFVANDAAGIDELAGRLRGAKVDLVALEATGGFERLTCRSPSSTRPRCASSPTRWASGPRPIRSTQP